MGIAPKERSKEEMRMKRTRSRLLSALLVLCMVLSMLPAGVMATEETTTPNPAITAVTATAKATAWPAGEQQPGDITVVIPSVVFSDAHNTDRANVPLEVRGLRSDLSWEIRFAEKEGYYSLQPDKNGLAYLNFPVLLSAAAEGVLPITAEVYVRGQWDDTLNGYSKTYAYETVALRTCLADPADYPLEQEQLDAASFPISANAADGVRVEFYLPYDLEIGSWLNDNYDNWNLELVKDGVIYAARYGSNSPNCRQDELTDSRFVSLFEHSDAVNCRCVDVWSVYGFLALARPLVVGTYDAVIRSTADNTILYTAKNAAVVVDAPIVDNLSVHPDFFSNHEGSSTAYASMQLTGGSAADYVLKLYGEDGTLLGTSDSSRPINVRLDEVSTVFAIPLDDGAALEKGVRYTIRAERKDGQPVYGQTSCMLNLNGSSGKMQEAILSNHYYLNPVVQMADYAGQTLRFDVEKYGEALGSIYATGDENGWFELEFTDGNGDVLTMDPWDDYEIIVYSRHPNGEWWRCSNQSLHNSGVMEFSFTEVLASRETMEVSAYRGSFDLSSDLLEVSIRVNDASALTDLSAFSAVLTGVDGTEYAPISLRDVGSDLGLGRINLEAALPETIHHGYYFAAVLYDGKELVTSNGENIFYEGDTTRWPTLYTDRGSMNTYGNDWLGLEFSIGAGTNNSKYFTAPSLDFYAVGSASLEPDASYAFTGDSVWFDDSLMDSLEPGTRYYIAGLDNGNAVSLDADGRYVISDEAIGKLWEQYYAEGTYPTHTVLVDELMENGSIEILSPFGAEAAAIPAYSEVYARIIPDEGYEYVPGSLRVNGKSILGRGFLVTEDCVVTAQFRVPAVPTYFITPNTSWVTDGWLQADRAEAQAGETVIVRVYPDNGYMISDLEGPYYLINADESTKTYLTPIPNSDGGYTFTMPAANVELFARFSPIPTHYIRNRVSDEDMAHFTELIYRVDHSEVDSLDEIPMGVQVQIEYTLEPGWAVDDVYATGHSTGSTYTFWKSSGNNADRWFLDQMPNENLNLYMTFRQLEQYTVTVDAAMVNGTLSPDTAIAYEGQWVTGTWTAAPGYTPDWLYYTDDEGSQYGFSYSDDGTFRFRMPACSVVLGARFRELPAEGPGGTVTTAAELQTAMGGSGCTTLDGSTVKLEKDVTLLAPVVLSGGALTLDLNGFSVHPGFESDRESAMFIVSAGADFTLADSQNQSNGRVAVDGTNEYPAGLHTVWVQGGTFRLLGAWLEGQWAEYTSQSETHAALRVSAGTAILGGDPDSTEAEGTGIRANGAADAISISGGNAEILSGSFFAQGYWADEPEGGTTVTPGGGSDDEKSEEEKAEEEAAGQKSIPTVSYGISTYGGVEEDDTIQLPGRLDYARCGAVVRVFKTGSVTISDGWFSSDDAAGNALLVQDSGKARVNGGWFESQFGDAAVKVESPDADVELSKARIYARYQCSIIVPEGKAIADYLAEGTTAWANFDNFPYELSEADLNYHRFGLDLAVDTPVEITVTYVDGDGTWELPEGAMMREYENRITFIPEFGMQVKEAWYMDGDQQYWIGWDTHYTTRVWPNSSKLDFTIVLEPIERHEGLFNTTEFSLASKEWFIHTNMYASGSGDPYTQGVLTDLSGKNILLMQETPGASSHLQLVNPGDLEPGIYRLYMIYHDNWGTSNYGWDYIELTHALPNYAWIQGQVGVDATTFTARLELESTPITAIPEGLTLQLWDRNENRKVAESSDYTIRWSGSNTAATDKDSGSNGASLDFTFTLKRGMLNDMSEYMLIPAAPGTDFLKGEEYTFFAVSSPIFQNGRLDPETLVWTGSCMNVADGTYETTYSSEATDWMTVAGPVLTVSGGVATLVFPEAPFDLANGGSIWFNVTVPGYGTYGFDVSYWPTEGGKELWVDVYLDNAAWVSYRDPYSNSFDYALEPEHDGFGGYKPHTLQVSAPGLAGMSGTWKAYYNSGTTIGEGSAEDLSSFTATVSGFYTFTCYRLELCVDGKAVGTTTFRFSFDNVLGADPRADGLAKDGKFTVYPMSFTEKELESLIIGVRHLNGTMDLPYTVNDDGTLTLDVSNLDVGDWTILATYVPESADGKEEIFPVSCTEKGWNLRIRPETGSTVTVKPLVVTEADGSYTAEVEYEGGKPASSVTMTIFRLTDRILTLETSVNLGIGTYTVDSRALKLSGSYVLAFTLADGTMLGAESVTFGEPAPLTVTFVDWNGAVLDTQTVSYGQAAAAPETKPQREGYVFTGWNVSFSHITKDTVVTALYAPTSLTVRFYTVSGIDAGMTQTVLYGELAERPAEDPQREGYWFLGWSSAPNSTKEWSFEKSAIRQNTILYAIWEKEPSQLTIAEDSTDLIFLHGYDASKATWQIETKQPEKMSGILALYADGRQQNISLSEDGWLFHVPDYGMDVTVSAMLKPEPLDFTIHISAPEGSSYDCFVYDAATGKFCFDFSDTGVFSLAEKLQEGAYTMTLKLHTDFGIQEYHSTFRVSSTSTSHTVTVELPVTIPGVITGVSEKAVLQFWGNGRWHNISVGKDGSFQFPALTPGTYNVYCYEGSNSIRLEEETFTITAQTQLVTLNALPSANVLVTLFTPETAPAEQVYVTLEKQDGDHWFWISSATISGEGGSTGLMEGAVTEPGTYRVRVDFMSDDRGFGLAYACEPYTFLVAQELEANYVTELVYTYPAAGSLSDLTGAGNLVALDRSPVFAGEFVNLTIRYQNNGRSELKDVVFAVQLPDGVSLYDESQLAALTVGSIASGESGSITLTLKAAEEGEDIRKIPVSVTAAGAEAQHFGDGLMTMAHLTLTGPSTVQASSNVTLTGEAKPGSIVTIKNAETGESLAFTEAVGRYYSVTFPYAATSETARFVAVCENRQSDILTAQVVYKILPAVRAVNMNSEELVFNKKLGAYATWQYVDLDMRGYNTALDVVFNEDELSPDSRILTVKILFCGKEYTAKRDSSGTWSAWLTGWGGSGLKAVTAEILTADGVKHLLTAAYVNLLVDPSGVITDEAGNPLAGVTVTCLQLQENGSWTVWNAEDYGQMNPVVTGEDGKYGFMVPEGTYRIVASKDGFKNYDSLEDENFCLEGASSIIIPPPRTDVDFVMISDPLSIYPTVSVGGSAAADLSAAKVGQAVTVTLTPEAGYRSTGVQVITTGGKTISANLSENTASFVMPAEAVTVRGIFASEAEASVSASITYGIATVTTENLHVDAIIYVAFYTAEGQFLSAALYDAAASTEIPMGDAGMIRAFLMDNANTLRPLSISAEARVPANPS